VTVALEALLGSSIFTGTRHRIPRTHGPRFDCGRFHHVPRTTVYDIPAFFNRRPRVSSRGPTLYILQTNTRHPDRPHPSPVRTTICARLLSSFQGILFTEPTIQPLFGGGRAVETRPPAVGSSQLSLTGKVIQTAGGDSLTLLGGGGGGGVFFCWSLACFAFFPRLAGEPGR